MQVVTFLLLFLFDCARLCPKVLHTWNNAEMIVFKHVVSVHLAKAVLASAADPHKMRQCSCRECSLAQTAD